MMIGRKERHPRNFSVWIFPGHLHQGGLYTLQLSRVQDCGRHLMCPAAVRRILSFLGLTVILSYVGQAGHSGNNCPIFWCPVVSLKFVRIAAILYGNPVDAGAEKSDVHLTRRLATPPSESSFSKLKKHYWFIKNYTCRGPIRP